MEKEESSERGKIEKDELKVRMKTLKAVMEQCKRALEAINPDNLYDENNDSDPDDDDDSNDSKVSDERGNCEQSSSPDHEAEEVSCFKFG